VGSRSHDRPTETRLPTPGRPRPDRAGTVPPGRGAGYSSGRSRSGARLDPGDTMRKIKAYKPRKTKGIKRSPKKPGSKPKGQSDIEALFERQLKWAKEEFPSVFPDYVTEYKFHPRRKFRADFHLVNTGVLIEISGGIWTKMGHSTGYGIARDYEKANEAQRLGFVLFKFTTEQVKSGYAISYIVNAFLLNSSYFFELMYKEKDVVCLDLGPPPVIDFSIEFENGQINLF
jgi:hypothetical protein